MTRTAPDSGRAQAPSAEMEAALRKQGYGMVAGVDEAGRGPLAGPVVAAAVVLGPDWSLPGLDDSKRLSHSRREELDELIRSQAACWSLGQVEAEEIDRLNIHHATLLAMRRAVLGLDPAADYLLVDGRFTLQMSLPQQAVVGGDRRCLAVAAASILAKVHRDRIMTQAHQEHPEYNFAANKGYPTAEHREALQRHGPCPLHRRSYGPVAQQCLRWSVD